jgi:hypothetical protein
VEFTCSISHHGGKTQPYRDDDDDDDDSEDKYCAFSMSEIGALWSGRKAEVELSV